MNKNLQQPNKLTLTEIHTRPELWKDKVYYLERNPYWNSSYDFLPIPKKYAEIIQEFQQEIAKQKKSQEEAEATKQGAQERINEIYQQIKEIIQSRITTLENSFIVVNPEKIEEAKEVQQAVQQIIQDIQQFFKNELSLVEEMPTERYYKPEDLKPYLKETSFKKFKEWETKWGTITKTEEIEDYGEREIGLLESWEDLNGGQPPFPLEQVESKLLEQEEKTKQEQIKNLKLGLNKKNLGQFSKWTNDNQFEGIRDLLDEWKACEGAIKKNYNSCFILEHTNEYLKFTFQPPRQIFVNLKDFLFYRSNTWYEVESWERINHVNAIITCKRSVFLSYYVYFLSKGINGVLHNSPYVRSVLEQRIIPEICQCPAFMDSVIYEEYNCSWEPKYSLWKVEGLGGRTRYIKESSRNVAPYISAVQLEPANLSTWDSFKDTTYLILPRGYNDTGVYWSGPGGTAGEKITFYRDKKPDFIFNEKNWAQENKNDLNEHTKKHVSLQFYWRKKLLGTYTLADFDPEECYLKIKANGAAIIYTLMSKKIYVRWSEDVKTTIEKDKWAGGLMNMIDKWTGIGISQVTNALFHDQNTEEDKSESERQSERKTKYAGTAKVVESAMASLPSMLAPSHVKCDYTMAEFALRYEQPSLKIRLEYNQNLFDRYKMEKSLKKNTNEWVNWEKVGNYLKKGYWKIVPHIFEGDKDGFFASIFSKGVYMYEEHPHEYFTTKLEGGKYRSNQLTGGNPQIESVFQKDLEETGGHDNVSQAGGGLWVYKSSYIRRQDGSGGNVFETLMNQAHSYRNHAYESSGKWVFKHPQNWNTEITMDEYATYVYDLHFFSSDHKNTHGVKGATKIVAEQVSEGNKSEIKVRFIGELEIQQAQDDPNEIGQSLPGGGSELDNIPEQEPEQNDDLINNIEKQEEPEGEPEQERQPEDELEPEPEEQKQPEQEPEGEPEQETERDKTKEKQKQKQKQKEDENQNEPENSREGEK